MLASVQPALLVLADGTVLEGEAFGRVGSVIGEVVFNTGMTGYQEVITDPSYAGQIVTFTYPELGNTGVNNDDMEAKKPHARSIVARQISPCPSSWRSTGSLQDWLEHHGVVGIGGLDTRALVRHLRKSGVMNGIVSSEDRTPRELLQELKSFPVMEGSNLVDQVTTKTPYSWNSLCPVIFDRRPRSNVDKPFRVVAIDFGIKKSILERLVAHGCVVTVMPFTSTLDDILALQPEGVFVSNGPGDPSTATAGIELVQGLLGQSHLPLFGICLGHQIIGLALGGHTFKLSYGHHGLNHPCGKLGCLEITSQNHGFALDAESLPNVVTVTQLNLNDHTVAAFSHKNQPVFGVQYHPEASPGPHDADHQFARFTMLMQERR